MVVRISKYLGVLAALGVLLALGSHKITAAYGDARTISLYNIHNQETLTILYKKGGKYLPEALKKLDWFFRDWRRNEATHMAPRLFDIIWEMHEELGSRKPVHLISGYRSLKTNNMLRRTVGGQARHSRHILAKAADIHFPDVPVRQMRYSALVRERGGVGYYPTSAIPFVHVDTGRVRHWPRMGRYELALLFPDGNSKHRPRGGGPITKRDVAIARRKHKALAQKVAAFYAVRNTAPGARRASRYAALTRPPEPRIAPPVPSLADDLRTAFGSKPFFSLASLFSPPAPRSAEHLRSALGGPVARPEPAIARPESAIARIAFTAPGVLAPAPAEASFRLASVDAQADLAGNSWHESAAGTSRVSVFGKDDGADIVPRPAPHWIKAPSYDEEHPDELSYRPVPIAPLLTESAADVIPVLSQLLQPDMSAERIVELLDQRVRLLPLRFRPGLQFAEMLWANRFAAGAIAGRTGLGSGSDGGLTWHAVHTARN